MVIVKDETYTWEGWKDKRERLAKTRTEQQKPTTTTTITKQNQTKPKQTKTAKNIETLPTTNVRQEYWRDE